MLGTNKSGPVHTFWRASKPPFFMVNRKCDKGIQTNEDKEGKIEHV